MRYNNIIDEYIPAQSQGDSCKGWINADRIIKSILDW
mgnify:CR=1 FL=1